MRFIEWFSWQYASQPDSVFIKHMGEAERQKLLNPTRKDLIQNEVNQENDDIRKAKMDTERHERAYATGPVYACNDTYVDMRCGSMEDKRGFITLVSVFWLSFMCLFAARFIDAAYGGFTEGWTNKSTSGIVVFPLFVTLFAYPYFKYGIHLSRMEMFTTRYLLIRFNRVTQQVYLHRPSNCGGVLVLPWKGIWHDYPGITPMNLTWYENNGKTDLPPPMVFVGKPGSVADQKALWEFIRRYMEEGGLSAVEKPEIASMFPWPWNGFAPVLEGLASFFANANALVWIGCFLLIPVFLLVGFCHWLSLLLCWTPRWPKIIREAGQPGKPTPKLTTIDDYPPDVAAQLKANAYRWKAHPGKKPPEPKNKTEPSLERNNN
jgi:hypothetical protein